MTDVTPPSGKAVRARNALLRFLWEIDGLGRFHVRSPEFIELMGPGIAAALGRPWSEIADRLALDPEGRVAAALATHETWTAIPVAWPVEGGRRRVAVDLSGLPVFDGSGAFCGYRGFGLCRDPPQRAPLPANEAVALTPGEQSAFQEIARALKAGIDVSDFEPREAWIEEGLASAEEPSRANASPSDVLAGLLVTPAVGEPAKADLPAPSQGVTRRLPPGTVPLAPPPPAADASPPDAPAVVAGEASLAERLAAAERARAEAEAARREVEAILEAAKRTEAELLAAKARAESASAAKSDFLAKISHEVRTVLNAVLGFAEVMMEERFGPIGNERYREYIRDIHASGLHVVSLVNDLLDLSKIEAGKANLAFAPLELNPLVKHCVGLMQPQAARSRIVIRSSLKATPPIMADERSVRQIVLNLLSNAIKFTGTGGQVIVSTACNAEGEVVLRVRDTGIGMSEQELKVALEPFGQVRLPPTTSAGTAGPAGAAASGTGLGLPLTKALAEANGARFSIRSAVDAGTMVEIAFPAHRPVA
jgi:signal transduction histidine kinase